MALGPDVRKVLVSVHVLVADQDAISRELLESLLTYCGALVGCTGDALEALAYAESKPIDVAIVDVTFPNDDGYWLAQRIGARVPVLALSTGTADGPDRTLAAGFHAHLRKPVDPWELCRVVAELARKA